MTGKPDGASLLHLSHRKGHKYLRRSVPKTYGALARPWVELQ